MGDKKIRQIIVAIIAFGVMVLIGWGYLEDNIVPEKGIEISEWMDQYYFCGGISIIIGILCSAIWYWKGIKYNGNGKMARWFWGLWFLSLVIAIIIDVAGLFAYVDGGLLATIFVILAPPVIYYVNTLWSSPAAVKYIPFLAKKIH